MISSVSRPKWAAILLAVTGPIPLIRSDPRYLRMPSTFDSGGIDRGVPGELELPSVLGMSGPEAFQADAFPGLSGGHRTDDGHGLAVVTSGLKSGDGVPGVFSLEGNAFEGAFEEFGHV